MFSLVFSVFLQRFRKNTVCFEKVPARPRCSGLSVVAEVPKQAGALASAKFAIIIVYLIAGPPLAGGYYLNGRLYIFRVHFTTGHAPFARNGRGNT